MRVVCCDVRDLRRWTSVLAVGGVAVLVACPAEEPTSSEVAIASVAISPAADTLLSLGETLQLAATPRDAAGNAVSGRSVSWSSANTAVATVSPSGLVTAVANGEAVIVAAVEDHEGTAEVAVRQRAVALSVSPEADTLVALDATIQFTVAAVDARQNPVAGAAVTWGSSDVLVATVDPTGLVRAINNGSATITATSGDGSGTAAIVVATNQVQLLPGGGTVSVAGGQVTLDVPAGAVSQAVVLTVEPTVVVPPTAQLVLSTAFAFTPEGTEFGAPVALTIHYDPLDLLSAESETSLHVGKVVGGAFVEVAGSVVDLVARSVTAPIDGLSAFGLLTAPPGPRVGVAVGDVQSCGVLASGSARCWGENDDAVFGDGTEDGSRTPVPAAIGLTLRSLSVATRGGNFACGIAAGGGGAAFCWGRNDIGQLGAGSGAPMATTPLLVAGGLALQAIDLGESHACGLTAWGHAHCWGSNLFGALGDGGVVVTSDVPRPVAGSLIYRAIATGSNFSCGISPAGQARCWGRLPGGNVTAPSPTGVGGGRTFGSAITAGETHVCALDLAGAAFCWGSNFQGELGDGTRDGSDVPVPVLGGLQFRVLSAGREHTCGITVSNLGYCWGQNGDAQLGDGTGLDRLVPALVAGGLSWKGLAAGEEHTCGVTTGDEFYCWGLNREGIIGDGAPQGYGAPNPVVGAHTFQRLVTGGRHTCAVTSGGAGYCWGDGFTGPLGNGTRTDHATPTAVAGGQVFDEIVPGDEHTCALTSGGAAYCWGFNSWGQVGDGTFEDRLIPTAVAGGLDFRSVSAAFAVSCAVTMDDVAYCWGREGSLVPEALGGGITFQSVSGACGVGVDELAYCWDSNNGGIGAGAQPVALDPVLSFASVSGDPFHGCGVTPTGAAHCWGNNSSGQLGDGTTNPSATPVPVAGGLSFAAVGSSGLHTCGITSGGAGYCWGHNGDGQLGIGSVGEPVVSSPVAVTGGLSLTAISTGDSHTCAITTTGVAYCWGRAVNAVGDGLGGKRLAPARVAFP
jgi:alpha-tubulin suppressor-like RCC1 family protein